MTELVNRWFKATAQAQTALAREQGQNIIRAARLVVDAFARGGKLMTAGNGGSAADAQHLAAEFVNRFRIERPPLPALALTTDTSVLTSIGNDYAFEDVFSKQIKALGREGDVLLAISTSGSSPNIIAAANEAKARGIGVIALTGGNGGQLADTADLAIVVPSDQTPVIQECHLVVEHLICELVDQMLFLNPEG